MVVFRALALCVVVGTEEGLGRTHIQTYHPPHKIPV
jgi:hypothetical protein